MKSIHILLLLLATTLLGADPTPQMNLTRLRMTNDIGSATPIKSPTNVAWFGAVGDGTADDTTAITNAITAAGANGVVLFEPGKTYKSTSQISIPADGIVLWGYGAIITSATQDQYRKFAMASRARVSVLGLRFDLIQTNGAGVLGAAAIEISGTSSDIVVRDCTFNDIRGGGVYVLGNCTRIAVERNTFYRNFCAIFTDDDTVNQPTFLRIVDNRIRTGLGGTGTAFSGAIKMSGTGSINSFVGDVISSNEIDTPGQMGIEIQTWINGTTIVGNTITGAGYGVSVSGCADVQLTGNDIKACSAYGVEIASSTTRTSVVGNVIQGANTTGVATTADGIIVSSGSKLTLSNNTITNCTANEIAIINASQVSVTGNTTFGVGGWNIKNSSNLAITGNAITGNGSGGYLLFFDSTDSNVEQIVFSGNRLSGVAANNVILFYHPANAIQDILLIGNQTSGASTGGGQFLNESGAGTFRRVRLAQMVGPGTQGVTTDPMLTLYPVSADQAMNWYLRGVTVSASGAARAITLPSATGIGGEDYYVIKNDASGNAVTVGTTGGQTINGSATFSLGSQWKYGRFMSDGTNWVVTANN